MSHLSVFLNDTYTKLNPISFINCRHLLNLSHNEAHHPEYPRLFAEFIEQYPVELVSKYPVFEKAHALVSENHGVVPDQLLLVPGSDYAISLLMSAIGINTDGLIIQNPNYHGYFHYAQLNNINIQATRTITPSLLHTRRQCLVALSNPEGFFGSVISLEKIIDIANACTLQNHLLLLDEAYIAFNYFDHQQLLNKFDNVIIVRSYSKGMGLASMRLGVIMGNPFIISYLSRFAAANCISDVALSYLMFLFKNKVRWKKINQEICALRDSLTEKLRSNFPLWEIHTSHANFITLTTRSNSEAINIKEVLLENGIRVCRFEDNAFSHCIRITIPPQDMIETLLKLLKFAYHLQTVEV